jgi:AcrR family transcriptional regulator
MNTRGPAASSHYRAAPVQARSAATVENILKAAAEILVADGLPGFNTNSVAKAARVNVATLYHYFPHKNAILAELLERHERQRTDFVVGRLDETPAEGDPTPSIEAMVGGLRRLHSTGGALRRACRAIPELAAVEEQISATHAAKLAGWLRWRFPGLPEGRELVVAHTMIEVAAGVLDAAVKHPHRSEIIVAELIALLRGYMSELEKASAAAGG